MITQQMCFHPQGSIGDCFVVAGAVNWFSDRCLKLFLPIYKKTNMLETIATLFQDNKKVQVIEYEDHQTFSDLNQLITTQNLTPITIPSLYSIEINGVTSRPLWEEQIYTGLDLPFSIRYSHFRMPNVDSKSKELFNRVVKNSRYILVSQKMKDPSTQVSIDLNGCRNQVGLDSLDKFQIIELNETLSSNIILYSELIKHAEEIHCVPSSLHCFIDSIIQTTNAKLFYHALRKDATMRVNNNWNNHRWQIVNYLHKL